MRAVGPSASTWIESALRRERLVLSTVLIGIPAACWGWVVAMGRDMYGPMTGASAWMMTMTWDTQRLILLWGMWAAMMAGMMLPAAAPILLMYGRAARARTENDSRPHYGSVISIYALTAGYLLVWSLFSIGATVTQRLLATQFLLTPMMEPATPIVGAVVLIFAGIYQFLPFKHACLSTCRSPLAFLMQRWRSGPVGAFRMGLEHGLYCLGCCWALMLVLFAGGVMNLLVILGLTLWVMIEKLSPFGQQSARVGGALLIVVAVWMLIR